MPVASPNCRAIRPRAPVAPNRTQGLQTEALMPCATTPHSHVSSHLSSQPQFRQGGLGGWRSEIRRRRDASGIPGGDIRGAIRPRAPVASQARPRHQPRQKNPPAAVASTPPAQELEWRRNQETGRPVASRKCTIRPRRPRSQAKHSCQQSRQQSASHPPGWSGADGSEIKEETGGQWPPGGDIRGAICPRAPVAPNAA